MLAGEFPITQTSTRHCLNKSEVGTILAFPEFQRVAGVAQEGPLAKSTRVDQRAAKSETATLENEPVLQAKRVATKEEERLYSPFKSFVPPWRRWGPYVSARSWGTVREDYSADGDAWNYLS